MPHLIKVQKALPHTEAKVYEKNSFYYLPTQNIKICSDKTKPVGQKTALQFLPSSKIFVVRPNFVQNSC
jgi:hypothetical protein